MSTTLLLADDSPTIAKILTLALQSEPYEIKSVLTAEDALRELKANPPHFFLCDLTLPEKNGYEFARIIRADSKLNKIRVVLLASSFEPVDEVEYQACGADGLIKKPFDPSELRAKLRSLHDAPPKFPSGSKVTGSLSGFMVSAPESTPTNPRMAPPPLMAAGGAEVNLSAPAPAEAAEDLSSLLEGNSASGDADAILAGLLGGNADPAPSSLPAPTEEPPPFSFGNSQPDAPPPTPSAAAKLGLPELTGEIFTNATVALDLSGENIKADEAVLDISSSFTTPAGGTAVIDMSLMGLSEPPASPPASPPSSAAEAPLSANAQALAAFFSAEIQSQEAKAPEAAPPPFAPAAPVTPDDSFDSSLTSIEWTDGKADAALDAWSSNTPKSSSSDTPPPKPGIVSAPGAVSKPITAPAASTRRPPTAGASSLFDTGGSTFRFAEDYVTRITKSFTGAHNEEVPAQQAAAPGLFPQKSDDSRVHSPGSVGVSGGGAWSEADVQKIEQIVREEVQMVVREVAEKIAWEVIPELAENIIRKELDKVLKEMEPS